MARAQTPAKLAFDKKYLAISRAYDLIKVWPPCPADLTAYARAMRDARNEYNTALDLEIAK